MRPKGYARDTEVSWAKFDVSGHGHNVRCRLISKIFITTRKPFRRNLRQRATRPIHRIPSLWSSNVTTIITQFSLTKMFPHRRRHRWKTLHRVASEQSCIYHWTACDVFIRLFYVAEIADVINVWWLNSVTTTSCSTNKVSEKLSHFVVTFLSYSFLSVNRHLKQLWWNCVAGKSCTWRIISTVFVLVPNVLNEL